MSKGLSISFIFVAMKNILFLLIGLIILSCNDGNFDTPEFQFSSIEINDCGELVLFKINGSEALFINFTSSDIKNEEGESLLTISTSRPVTYRVLDDQVTSSYFCNNIPPTSPQTLRNWTGTGSILIQTEEQLDSLAIGTGIFLHQINLINLVLSSDKGTLSYDDYDFGIYETATTN